MKLKPKTYPPRLDIGFKYGYSDHEREQLCIRLLLHIEHVEFIPEFCKQYLIK